MYACMPGEILDADAASSESFVWGYHQVWQTFMQRRFGRTVAVPVPQGVTVEQIWLEN